MCCEQKFPVSIKGVLLRRDKAVLLKNGREEWELPGGRLEAREAPEECLAREMNEELGVTVSVGPILDSWMYEIFTDAYVLIVTYGCFAQGQVEFRVSSEHEDVGLFGLEDLPFVNAPAGYKNSVKTWMESSNSQLSGTEKADD